MLQILFNPFLSHQSYLSIRGRKVRVTFLPFVVAIGKDYIDRDRVKGLKIQHGVATSAVLGSGLEKEQKII